MRKLIVDSTGYEVFVDVEPALRRLAETGWIQAVVSNHIPELAYLLANLGLAQYFVRVYTSAIVGYEKPHPGFLGRVLGDGPWPAPVWMVGDSVAADCLPARAYGCRAILVRTLDERFRPRVSDLSQAVDLITAQMPACEG
jgi:putative hydrolase of the HAD superfamily